MWHMKCVMLIDTATTAVYTYWLTLPLHDALPSFIEGPQPTARGDGLQSRKLHVLHRFAAFVALGDEGKIVVELRPPPVAQLGRRLRVRPRQDGFQALDLGIPLQDFEAHPHRSEEHTSELQSLMRISYAVFCLKKKKKN